MKMTKKGFTLVELMVVIVIVGILAAVAIPKFTKASHKAKASEFPTVLMSVYTSEIAYEAETGDFSDLAAIGLEYTKSNWFSYTCPLVGSTEFTATATVMNGGFGDAVDGNAATIDETGAKTNHANLLIYAPNWKP